MRMRYDRIFECGRHVVKEGTVLAKGTAHVRAYGNARVWAVDEADVSAYHSAQVWACDDARIDANGEAEVYAYGNARVWAYGPKIRVERHNDAEVTWA